MRSKMSQSNRHWAGNHACELEYSPLSHPACVNFEDLQPTFLIRQANLNLHLQAARAQHRLIKHVLPARRDISAVARDRWYSKCLPTALCSTWVSWLERACVIRSGCPWAPRPLPAVGTSPLATSRKHSRLQHGLVKRVLLAGCNTGHRTPQSATQVANKDRGAARQHMYCCTQ
jgi:hypothetical protein